MSTHLPTAWAMDSGDGGSSGRREKEKQKVEQKAPLEKQHHDLVIVGKTGVKPGREPKWKATQGTQHRGLVQQYSLIYYSANYTR